MSLEFVPARVPKTKGECKMRVVVEVDGGMVCGMHMDGENEPGLEVITVDYDAKDSSYDPTEVSELNGNIVFLSKRDEWGEKDFNNKALIKQVFDLWNESLDDDDVCADNS